MGGTRTAAAEPSLALSTTEAAALPGDGDTVSSSCKGSVSPLIAVGNTNTVKRNRVPEPSQSSWGQLRLQPWPPAARGQAVSKDGWSYDANSTLGF